MTAAQTDHLAQGRSEPTTVAIAKFTAAPLLVGDGFHFFGVLEYAGVGCVVMVALAAGLLVAAVAIVREASAVER